MVRLDTVAFMRTALFAGGAAAPKMLTSADAFPTSLPSLPRPGFGGFHPPALTDLGFQKREQHLMQAGGKRGGGASCESHRKGAQEAEKVTAVATPLVSSSHSKEFRLL